MKLILLALGLLSAGVALSFLMVLGLLAPSFALGFLAYAASVSGLGLGIVAAIYFSREQRQRKSRD